MKQLSQAKAVLDLHDRMRLALDAEVDLRTLDRALSGQPIKPISRRRILRTLSARGLLELLPATDRER